MGNQTQQHIGTTTEMNKLFLSLLLLLLPPSTSGEKATGEFLSDLCAKCNYCTTENADNKCTGCAKCSECTPKQRKAKEGKCRFCKRKETEEGCVARCQKGCRICAGKDGNGLDSCKERRK